ncbi:hypothetical protein BGX38DRAFT_260257 [Terfezia claveryi]|nr:hypothetical protein BGX38DRAFT_260257 [Terfezia claveryi]
MCLLYVGVSDGLWFSLPGLPWLGLLVSVLRGPMDLRLRCVAVTIWERWLWVSGDCQPGLSLSFLFPLPGMSSVCLIGSCGSACWPICAVVWELYGSEHLWWIVCGFFFFLQNTCYSYAAALREHWNSE